MKVGASKGGRMVASETQAKREETSRGSDFVVADQIKK
jgi:hypothetical protein